MFWAEVRMVLHWTGVVTVALVLIAGIAFVVVGLLAGVVSLIKGLIEAGP